jgi:hydroxymethylpyrimidine/phosphomethylpyrimidine kinase
MPATESQKKVVLTIAGHDPSGAAGIQADIETFTSLGCRAVSIITALTAQNTSSFLEILPQQPEHLRRQCQLLLSDINIDACKIGLLGNLETAAVIAEILDTLIDVPVVLDPILRSGTGMDLVSMKLQEFIRRKLMQRALVLTPNSFESRQLAGTHIINDAGTALVEGGCPHVLITGGDEAAPDVTNILFQKDAEPIKYKWERLPGTYHGSGCTLSSAIAAYIANGIPPKAAIEAGQAYTWKSLHLGTQLGRGQMHPNRNFHDG